jgi:hypothetical protein
MKNAFCELTGQRVFYRSVSAIDGPHVYQLAIHDLVGLKRKPIWLAAQLADVVEDVSSRQALSRTTQMESPRQSPR